MKLSNHPKVDKLIRSLSKKDQARIVRVIELFEEKDFSLTENHLKKLAKGLWELRAGRWRILFGVHDKQAFGVNIFIKDTQKIPKKEIDLALKRLMEAI